LDYLLLECLKILVLYLKFGNLSGVLGLFVSIGWCFYLLIDPRGLPKWSTRVVSPYPLKNTCLSISFLLLLLFCTLPVCPCTAVHSTVHSFCPQANSCSQPVRAPCTPVLQPVHSYCPASHFDLGSFECGAFGVCKVRYINWYQSFWLPSCVLSFLSLNTTLFNPNT